MAVNYKPLNRDNTWNEDKKIALRRLFGLAEVAAAGATAATISRSVVNRTIAGKLDAGEEQDIRTLFDGLRRAMTDTTGITLTDLTFADADPDTIASAAGDFTTFVAAGDTIVVTDSTSNDGSYLVDTVTSLLITLDAAETLVAEGTADVTATISRDGTAYDLQRHFSGDRWTGNQRKIIKAMAQSVVDMISA